MSLLENLLVPGTIERLGWMLIHILWQATAVAVLLAVFLRLLRNAGANVRYGIACAALALMVAMPIVTMRWMKTPGPAAEAGPPSVIVALPPEATAPPVQAFVEATGEIPAVAQLPGPLPAADVTVRVPLQERIVSTLEPALPYVVLGWLVGVLGLSAWHLGGWAQLQRLRRRMVREVGRPLQQRLEKLSIRLGVHRAVGLLESALIEVPTVVGWLRPVILLPASALTGLRPEQLEAILAHELAHVRRYDYLVNIAQTVVEILGFYHPAIWWVSRRIRIERENCCDDLAVHVCGSSLQYARALACMEEIRHSASDLAMAATGGSLMARIARLLGRPTVDDRRFTWLPGLVALLLVAGLIIPAALVLGTPQRPQAVEPATVAATHDAAEPNGAPSKTESAAADVPAAQVLLEFKIVKVLDEARVDRETLIQIANALGIVLPARGPDQSSQTLDLTAGEVFRRYILPQPLSKQAGEAVNRLLQSQGSAQVLSSPAVLARDGVQAQIRIGNERWLAGSDPSAQLEKIEYGTVVDITPRVLDANRVNLEMRTEVSDLAPGTDPNQPTVLRTSAETNVTAPNDRYLVWAAVAPAAAPAGQEADRRSVYIMVKPHINLPPQGLATVPDERRPDGTPPRQVLLNVRTVTMNSGALDSLGVPWSRPTGGPSASVRTGSAMDETFTDALLTALDRLQADHQATVSSQQIIVQEGHQSQIKALRDQWSAGAQPHKTETGTVVKVRPHVADDNTIRLELAIDATRQLPTPPGSDLPLQSAQTCQSTVTIKDGGAAAIGGLSVPGAQGRPGQETVIFVTTHLLPDRKETPVGTPQAAGPYTRVTPPVSPTPEQTASMRREYVNSDPMVNELSKSIVAMERDLITQQALVKEPPRLSQEQAALVDLKDKLVSRRRELEKEFDKGLTARTGGSLGDRTEKGKRTTITATFTNTDLRDVLSEIAQRAGVKITPDATVKATPVTTELADASVDAALQQVLKNTPYTFRSIGDNYDVFRPQSFTFAGTDLVKSLRDLSASAEVPIVVDPNVRGDVYVRFENEPLEEALQLMLAGKPLVYKKTPSYYLVAGRVTRNLPFSEDPLETRRIRLNYVRPAQVTQHLSPVFAPYVQAERPNPRDPNDQGNTLLVTASPAIAERIVTDIKRIDRPKRQVLLDARVVAMEKGNLLNLGVEWNWPTIQAGAFTSTGLVGSTGTATGSSPYGVQIGYTPDRTFTDSLTKALNLLVENKQADIIANPKVVAQDGRQAKMKVIEEQWFMMTAPPTQDGSDTRPELQKIESGTVLTITPCIGDNNDITLQMAVEVSDSIPKARGSDLPVVTRRTAKNSVTVKDGGTVAVGGLTENRTKMTEKRVPVLGSIPLIGGLFRSTTNDKSSREVAVFVTVHLVPDTGTETPQASESGATTVRIPPPTGESGPGRVEGKTSPETADTVAHPPDSHAWSILRQQNCPPLLLGLTQRLLKVLEPARQGDAAWQEVGGGGSLQLDVKIEQIESREITVGLFADAKWSQEPVAVRLLPGAGTHTLTGLPAGRYQIGAMMGRAPSPAALGVQRTWPAAIEIKSGQTTTAELLVSRDFAFNASGRYNREVSRDYTGDWSLLNDSHLLQGRLTGPDGVPIAFGRVDVREYQAVPTGSVAAPELGTNEDGFYKFDGMKWPYRIGTTWSDTLPDLLGYRYQYKGLNRVLEGPQKVDFQFDRFPAGTARIAGHVVDEHGAAVTTFYLRVRTLDSSAPARSGGATDSDAGVSTIFEYKVPFLSADGSFTLSGLPAGRVAVNAAAFDYRPYQRGPDKEVMLEAGKTTEVRFEMTHNQLFYGRVLFEDGSPAVVQPIPWEGARTTIEIDETMPFGLPVIRHTRHEVAELDAEGRFAVYFPDTELEGLQSGTAEIRIRLPGRQEGQWQSGGKFPFDKLAQDKAQAGTVTVKRPAFMTTPAAATPPAGAAVPVELRSVGSPEEMRTARELQENPDSDPLVRNMKKYAATYKDADTVPRMLMDRISEVQRGLSLLQQTVAPTHPAVIEKKALLATLQKELAEKPTGYEPTIVETPPRPAAPGEQ